MVGEEWCGEHGAGWGCAGFADARKGASGDAVGLHSCYVVGCGCVKW